MYSHSAHLNVIVSLVLLIGACTKAERQNGEIVSSLPGSVPPVGAVPNALIAKRVAAAIVAPLAGSERMDADASLTAELQGDSWRVVSADAQASERWLVELGKSDGQVLRAQIAGKEFRADSQPSGGFVPDQATAVRIAEAILEPIYGEGPINSQKPLLAKDSSGVWRVRGQLPRDHLGGVAEVSIDRRTGRIMAVDHGR